MRQLSDGSDRKADRGPPSRGLYGRRRGHRLTARRERLMAELLPRLRVPPTPPGMLDPRSLFTMPIREAWLEIGFGAGEHLAWQSARNPEVGLLGAEPFINGVATLLAAIEDHGHSNIRIHDGDGRDLVEWLIPASLARVFILFPDPWPKARHHKRRLIEDRTVADLARVMTAGAELRIASDIADFQRWTLEHLIRAGAFEWLAGRAADWRERTPDWPATRYEEKAVRAGHRPAYLTFRRL